MQWLGKARFGLAFAPVLAVASPVFANTFASDGTFIFAPDAAVQEGFENHLPPLDGSYQVVELADALEGTKALQPEGMFTTADIVIPLSPTRDAYRATVWLRGEGFSGMVVGYEDGTEGDLALFFPTGRMTSDNWIEFASESFMVDGTRGGVAVAFFAGPIFVDGLELTRASDVPFQGPQRCEGVRDPSCTGDRLCLSGWCRRTSGWVPPLPAGPERDLLTNYLENRIRYFFGPHANRKRHLPSALAELEGMRTAGSGWRYWSSMVTALRRLEDSHTRASSLVGFVLENPRPLNACFIVGQADVSQTAAPSHPDLPDLLVSHVGTEQNWDLHAGDRLVAIDDKHPLEWMRSLITHDSSFATVNDPDSPSQSAESMRSAIPRYAQSITVVRCTAGACGAPETIEIAAQPEVDPDTELDIVSCDHRPGPLVANQPDDHRIDGALRGSVLGTQPNEKIYGLVWNDLVVESSSAQQIEQAVASWRADARGVILDHRTGNGGRGEPGTTASADPILAFVREPTLFGVDVWRSRADEEGPETLAEGLSLVERFTGTQMAWRGGSTSAVTDVPVALMVTRDVSFSDLFPYAFQGAPKTRIFGPHPTNGAFSSFFSLSYWFGFNLQIAAGDTVGADGQSLCGHGVVPDEEVWPTQSDLLAGKDTLTERALSWVRAELAP